MALLLEKSVAVSNWSMVVIIRITPGWFHKFSPVTKHHNALHFKFLCIIFVDDGTQVSIQIPFTSLCTNALWWLNFRQCELIAIFIPMRSLNGGQILSCFLLLSEFIHDEV